MRLGGLGGEWGLWGGVRGLWGEGMGFCCSWVRADARHGFASQCCTMRR